MPVYYREAKIVSARDNLAGERNQPDETASASADGADREVVT
jgi:hypothetical protein